MKTAEEIDVKFPHKILKRTRAIYYEGEKYHRRCNYNGAKVYIVYFPNMHTCQIEYLSGKQVIIEVDNDKLELIEYKS